MGWSRHIASCSRLCKDVPPFSQHCFLSAPQLSVTDSKVTGEPLILTQTQRDAENLWEVAVLFLCHCIGVVLRRKQESDSLFLTESKCKMQYGVKISLITSFKDTCFVEIMPVARKSARGFYHPFFFYMLFVFLCDERREMETSLNT